MAQPSELIAAVDAGDAAAVAAMVAAEPALAAARGDDGVSALLHARYRFHREVARRTARGRPRHGRVRCRRARPHRPAARPAGRGSGAGPAPTPRMASRPSTWPPSSASRRPPGPARGRGLASRLRDQRLRQPAPPCGGGRTARRGLPPAAGRRGRRERHPARRLRAAPRGGGQWRGRARRAVPVGRRRSAGHDRRRPHAGRGGRGGRALRHRPSPARGRRRA